MHTIPPPKSSPRRWKDLNKKSIFFSLSRPSRFVYKFSSGNIVLRGADRMLYISARKHRLVTRRLFRDLSLSVFTSHAL